MYVKNVPAEAVVAIARDFNFEAHVEIKSGGRVKFTLRNHSDKFHVVTDHKTMKSKVCYHGHYAFLENLFIHYPDAIVDASWFMRVKYNNENFHQLADEVGDTVVRQFGQIRVRDRCACE